MDDYDWRKHTKFSHSRMMREKTMNTALCIVPPDDAWDTIQRARHMAKDSTLYRWPPAIRLFHPFAPRPYLASAASAIAELIECEAIEPFEITLDTLVVRPNLEAVEQLIADTESEYDTSSMAVEEEEEELDEVQQLIRREEIIGKERYERRVKKEKNKQKLRAKEEAKRTGNTDSAATTKARQMYKSHHPVKKNKKEKPKYEYEGPCIITLEPNEESQTKLEQLRTLLKDKLFAPYDSISISAALSLSDIPLRPSDNGTADGFRPAITLGSFPTTESAVETARRLQELWEPLSFDVTDMHLISRDGVSDLQHLSSTGRGPSDHKNLATAQYECDAMIVLMGEEAMLEGGDDNSENMSFRDSKKDSPDGDSDNTNDLLSLLFRAGEDGGGASSLDYKEESMIPPSVLEKTSRMEEKKAYLKSVLGEDYDDDDFMSELWYDDDDDEETLHDEGATIVIGRTLFLLGEMRLYVGMPAANPMSKDKVLGQGVSALARRRGAIHRQEKRWDNGDYGTKEKDRVP